MPSRQSRSLSFCLFLCLLATVITSTPAAAQTTAPNEWMWMGGSSTHNQPGVYGTLGTAASGNVPGSRSYASNWIDNHGNLWLFGGNGRDSLGQVNGLNDLWMFNPSTNEWTWMGGNSVLPCTSFGQCGEYAGIYGTLGTAAAGNAPGARIGATSWTDLNGNLWLFGGDGVDAIGVQDNGWLNDLWKYSPYTNEWTWMSGSSTTTCSSPGSGSFCGTPGLYNGTSGTYVVGNVPAGRMGAMGWTDKGGMLWLFGGMTMVEAGVDTYLNDLWQFNPSSGEWTWMGGNSAAPCPAGVACNGASGVYGTLGTPSAANIPGAREFGTTWTDSNGNLWLFGGEGMVANGGNYLNDLWRFNPSTNQWTWMGGSNTLYTNGGAPGVYGTMGVPAAGNQPGARVDSSSWTDRDGNLWLFGGSGFDANGKSGYLNDVWKFSPTLGEWVWMSGSAIETCVSPIFPFQISTCGQSGIYGTLQTPAVGNVPGGRVTPLSWTDGQGNFWLFGGMGLDGTGQQGYLNDLWEYQPPAQPSTNTPTFSVAAGTYSTAQTVAISDATPGANLFYTTDGSLPTTSSVQYSQPFQVSSSETIRAIASAPGYSVSNVASAAYEITPTNTQQTIDFSPIPSPLVFGVLPMTLSAKASSGLPVAFNVLSGPATVNGSTLTITGAETVIVTADQAGNATYAAAESVQTVVVNQATPTINWANPAAISYGTPLGAIQLDATASVSGTYFYVPPTGTVLGAGSQTLSVSFVPTDTTDYTNAAATAQITVTAATSAVTVSCPASVVYIGSAQTPCTASATGAGSMNVPLTVIYANNTNVGIATASAIFAGDANHTASSTVVNFAIVPSPVTVTAGSYSGVYDGSMHSVPACLVTGAYKGSLSCLNSPASVGSGLGAGVVTPVVSGGTPNFVITMVNGTWSITQAVASVTLGNLAQIYTGTPMPVTVTTLPTGLGATVLYSGPSYPSSATPPTNPGSYTVTATVTSPNYTGTTTGTLVISPANAGLTLQLRSGMAEPSPYGTMAYFDLVQTGPTCPTGTVQFYVDGASSGSAVALNGSSCSSPVTFATAALAPGTHLVYAVYSGDTFYRGGNSNTVTHAIVADATAVTLATSATIVNVGQQVALMATVTPTYLDPGAQGPAGTVEFFDAGTSLGVVAVPNGSPYMAALTTSSLAAGMHSISATYVSSNGEFTGSSSAIALKVMVSKVAPAIIWSNPGSIAYGTALSGTQLNATAKDPTTNASVAGTFVYTPPAGTVLSAGVVNLMVNFIPTDTATYSTQSATVTLTVAPATPTLNWSTPAAIVYGTSLSGTQLNATSSTLGTFVYTPSTGAVPAAGSQTLSVTFTPTDKTNYTTATQSVNLQVNKAVITVAATNASVPYNQAIPSLNYTTTGYLNGDSSTVLGGAPLESTTAKQGSAIGSYPITIAQGTLSAANYSFQFQNGTLTISSLGTTATPVISPAGGTYTSARSVTITDATAGASIYYTTDGSTPTTSSTKYSAAINVSATETIKSMAVASGYSQSVVASAAYTINLPATATPTFTPGAGTYTSSQSVTIADKTSGAVIYYTTDGSTPTTSSTKYAGAIMVSSTQTIKAIALASGSSQSAVATAAYSITQPAATPTFSPASGTYTSAQTVFISDATAGATIYYTTNGSTPTTSTAKYTSAGITVSATETIKAIAVATGYTQSSVASASYVIATAPTVATSAATNLSTSGATLNGVVTANNASTQYWFMWGTNKSALTKTTTAVSGLNGATAKSVTAALTGLTTKTTYYFQLVASNAAGKSSGTVVAFTTK